MQKDPLAPESFAPRLRHLAPVVALALLILASTLSAQQVLPADTPIEIRLTRRVATQVSPRGSPVEAVVIAPVLLGDQVVIPQGSKVLGTVSDVRNVGLGFRHETASIVLQIDQVILPDGSTLPITTRVAQVENSRETVDKKSGRIHGIRSTSTLSHRASGAIGFLAFSNPVALIFTTASSAAVLRFSDPEISLPAQTELVLLTRTPITVPASIPGQPAGAETALVASTPGQQKALRNLVREQPYRTVTDKTHVPSDLTNLMFIGSNQAILRAFTAAGWVQVSSLDANSSYRTVRSISEQQAYRTAPMSTLLLEDRPPVDTLAKNLDTFSKRHHLRIFATQDQWERDPVFVSSSTQDIGIGFSAEKRTLIHQIDHNIDHERTKVVNDLMLTGCVTAINLVQRTWLPKAPKNGTGEPIITDGRMAVLRFNDCSAPMHVPDPSQTDALPTRTNIASHVTRQTVLTLRNTLLRDNIGASTYGLIKGAINFKHPKPPESPIVPGSSISSSQYAIESSADESVTPELQQRHRAAETGTLAEYQPRPPSGHFPPSTIELGVHGGFAGFAGGNGGGVGYILQDAADPINNPIIILALANTHDNGWNLGGTVTVNAHRFLSNEFAFDYNHTGFSLGFFALPIGIGTTSPTTENDFSFQQATLSTTEVAYNLLIHARPKGTRFRPYLLIGPSFRLMHLTEAPVTKASPWFKLGLSTVGSITAAYHFGSTPPLDGGGIFQFGLQYGAGFKYRVARRWLFRADYKETLSGQPDFWSKSSSEIFNDLALPGYSLSVVGPLLEGRMRQQRATTGISFVF